MAFGIGPGVISFCLAFVEFLAWMLINLAIVLFTITRIGNSSFFLATDLKCLD